MVKTVGIGAQDFEDLITNDIFYIDKTHFIKEWWENRDSVTLITRPRRFGKTLSMSMLEKFFSVEYKDRSDLFQGLAIWDEAQYRKLQGTYPVISLTFANVKEENYPMTKERIYQLLIELYNKNVYLLDSGLLTDEEVKYFRSISMDMPETTATLAIYNMSSFLSRYYGRKVIILLDEYDTPMQEAYVNGFWDELTAFTRSLFNAAFKTNPYMERAIMTGITRVSKESIFSDLNNLVVVTTTSKLYADCFGFTEDEVFQALDSYGLSDQKQAVKDWYDGFSFGPCGDIYNPWSILNYLKLHQFDTYWANTSSNKLVEKLIRESSKDIKIDFENLLRGSCLKTQVDEQVVYNELDSDETAIWSFLLAGGYLKVHSRSTDERGTTVYELKLTNWEVHLMFEKMVRSWFRSSMSNYNDFIKALLLGDVDAMNEYMNEVSQTIFSYFDTGRQPSKKARPERFYHGFVLGLMVDLADKYRISSNRESGFGRYDIVLEPRKDDLDAVIIEFKVFHPKKESSLEAAAQAALKQIAAMDYAAALRARGIPGNRIRSYGFAFDGKQVLIISSIQHSEMMI